MLAPVYAGQSTDSAEVQNWIGTVAISGQDLAQSLKKHVEAYADDVLDMKEETVQTVEKKGEYFVVTTDQGSHITRTVLVATGSHRRKLEAKGADIYEHKGLTYCASCDGPMFGDQDLAVVGAGNAAFETAAQLLSYAKSVTIINRSPSFNRADEITVDKVLSHPNMRAVANVEILEVKGDKFANAITIRDKATGVVTDLSVGGIFIEIGQLPNTQFLKDIVELNDRENVVVDPRTQKTSMPGIWSAGDCTDVLYHQNNIAAGDAVRALEDIFQYLHSK
ncbi:alkyl hydroperoxide reductase [sediment metagenome]|uniref:Alkyl hydroperoxide reductase n=1 Tax=sediment metagenome TaxID=749907 RepID=D9PJ41_9ZZZZ